MDLYSLSSAFGAAIEDPDEETFLLFSQSIPSQNLGFIDPKVSTIEVTVGSRDYSIRQSPTLLSSKNTGGTTGAVVWKIAPLVASWISDPANLLFKLNVLSSEATVLELGCGVSGIIGLCLAPLIRSYILTDQEYVMKILSQNLRENQTPSMKKHLTSKVTAGNSPSMGDADNVIVRSLDWETDEITPAIIGRSTVKSFEAVIASDCVYNDALIKPLVQTCIDACKLRATDSSGPQNPTACIIAQQLRSPEIFEEWLKAFHRAFRVWRIPDHELSEGLRSNSGFVVHIGMLR